MSRVKREHLSYYCDGSQMGMSIGAGVVEVDVHGFMLCNDYNNLHPLATSIMAEEFAVDCVLKKLEFKETKVNATVYVDCDHIRYKLEQPAPSASWDKYTVYLFNRVEKVRSLGHSIAIVRTPDDPAHYVYVNTAHALSRLHLNNRDKVFIEGHELLTASPSNKPNKVKINKMCKKPAQMETQLAKQEVETAMQELATTTSFAPKSLVKEKPSTPLKEKYSTDTKNKPSREGIVLPKTEESKNVFTLTFTKEKRTWVARQNKGQSKKPVQGKNALDVYRRAIAPILYRNPRAKIQVYVQSMHVSSQKQISRWMETHKKQMQQKLDVRYIASYKDDIDELTYLLDMMKRGNITTHFA